MTTPIVTGLIPSGACC